MTPLSHHEELNAPEPEPKESRRVILFLSLALVFLIVSATLGGILFASSAGLQPSKIFAKLRALTLSGEKMLQGESDDRINILLLGMGGPGHEGATLTDTMMFVSLRPSDKHVAMLSIPRDLQIKIPSYGYKRINSVNAYAEQEKPGSGAAVTTAAVSDLLTQPINYYLLVDFKAFKELIDTVGGIDVTIDQSFYDSLYPDENFGYAPVSFTAGVEHMNGQRALEFVRSRHGTGGEGSDFARARRQQKVLLALKERMLSFDVLLRPTRIKTILETLGSHIQTNIAFWEGVRMARLFKDIDTHKIVSRVLDASPDGVLVERNYSGAFVLEPKSGNFDAVRAIAAGLLDASPMATHNSSPPQTPTPPNLRGLRSLDPSSTPSGRGGNETISPPFQGGVRGGLVPTSTPTIEIQNGTFTVGLAAKIAGVLEAQGFNTASIGNASLRNVETTIVYDLTGGKKPDELKKLKTALKAIDGEGEPLHVITSGTLDFLVILGKNAQ